MNAVEAPESALRVAVHIHKRIKGLDYSGFFKNRRRAGLLRPFSSCDIQEYS
jgi:hypothetical protein